MKYAWTIFCWFCFSLATGVTVSALMYSSDANDRIVSMGRVHAIKMQAIAETVKLLKQDVDAAERSATQALEYANLAKQRANKLQQLLAD